MHWDLKNDAPICYLLPTDKMKQSEINDALSMLSCSFKKWSTDLGIATNWQNEAVRNKRCTEHAQLSASFSKLSASFFQECVIYYGIVTLSY